MEDMDFYIGDEALHSGGKGSTSPSLVVSSWSGCTPRAKKPGGVKPEIMRRPWPARTIAPVETAVQVSHRH